MLDGKKALTISTLVVSAIVLIWGAYTFLNNGILSPSNEKDVSTNVQDSQKQTQSEKSNESTQKDDTNKDSSTSTTDKTNGSDKDKNTSTTANDNNKNTSSTDSENKKNVEYVEYTVKSGDTLSNVIREIAKGYTFKEALELISEKNKLENPNTITVGQKILIPVINTPEKDKYMVKAGDTLTTIAKKLFPNMKLSEAIGIIMEKNNIDDADSITVGQIIIIPEIKEN